MLQGVQPEGHEICRVGQTDHAEYAALFLQLVGVGVIGHCVEIEGMRGGICLDKGQLRIPVMHSTPR